MQRNLDDKHLIATFFTCLFLLFCVPSLAPSMRLSFFAPFLIIACYQKPLRMCLWLGLLCGFLMDLLSSHTRLGLYAFDFCVTLIILYPQRRNFFADSASTLPIMTFLFALLSTFIMACLLYSVESRSVFSWLWVFTDLFCMPLIDAVYAFTFFILPALAFGTRLRKGKEYFLS